MAKLTDEEKYVLNLLRTIKEITEILYSDIDEIFRNRGRNSEEIRDHMHHIIDNIFDQIPE